MELPHGVESKFRLILLVAKRARQLQSGAAPLVQSVSKKPIKVALQEIEAGVLPFVIEDGSSTPNAHPAETQTSA